VPSAVPPRPPLGPPPGPPPGAPLGPAPRLGLGIGDSQQRGHDVAQIERAFRREIAFSSDFASLLILTSLYRTWRRLEDPDETRPACPMPHAMASPMNAA